MLILKLSSLIFPNWSTGVGSPFQNLTVATWHMVACLPVSQGRGQVERDPDGCEASSPFLSVGNSTSI